MPFGVYCFGTTDVALLKRDKVRKALLHAPNLQAKLENAKKSTDQGLIWDVEHDRINSLAIRLAQGHIAYEEFAIWDEPTCIYVNPLHTLPLRWNHCLANTLDLVNLLATLSWVRELS